MSESDKKQALIAWGLLVFLAIIWGSSFILIKRGLLAFHPTQVAGLRIFAAGLLLSPIAFQSFRLIKRKHWIPLFIVGLIGSLIPSFLFATAQSRLDSSIAGILNGLTPLFALLIGSLMFKQGFKLRQLIGILIGFIGCLAIIFTKANSGFGSLNTYALYIVLATLCYGTSVNVVAYFFKDLPSKAISSVSLTSVAPIGLIYLFSQDIPFIIKNDPNGWLSFISIVLLGFISTGIALVLFYKLLSISNPLFGSSVTYLIPFVAIIWGFFDGESLHIIHFLGLGLILAGVFSIGRK